MLQLRGIIDGEIALWIIDVNVVIKLKGEIA